MKKLISVILSMAMVLCMSVTGFAENQTYTITIENAAKEHTYTAYKIFSGDLAKGETTLTNIQWGDGINDTGKAAVLTDGKTTAEDVAKSLSDAADAKAFAKAIAPNGLGTAAKSATASSDTVNIEGLEPGYYLITDTKPNGSSDATSGYMVTLVKSTTISTKTGVPTVEKKVKDINDSTDTSKSDWQDSADHDIGDAVDFQLKGTIGQNYEEYDSYKFVFHDTLSDGLTFNKDKVKVYVDGKEITSGYTLVLPEGDNKTLADGCSFEVNFDNLKEIASVKSGSVITVEYTATLNSNAVIGSPGNPNKVYLEYSNNPNGEGTGKTPEDKVIVFTYKAIVNKVDSNGKPLTGAEFTLEKKVKKDDGTFEWKTIAVVKNDAGTTFTFTGLDDGDYRLTETTVPDGYNKIDPIEFTITAEHEIKSDNPTLTSLSGNKATGEAVFERTTITNEKDEKEDVLSADIVNNTGAELPETGGIGTKIFYVVGAALVIGAGVLLITRKRMSTR